MGEETPSRPFFPVQDEVRRMFQELIHQPWGGREPAGRGDWQPCVDISETPEAIIVEVELPGVQREDVRIEVQGEMLHITGDRRTTSGRQERNYYRVERNYGHFERQLRLPGTVEREAIRAEFEAGLLIITLPKRARR